MHPISLLLPQSQLWNSCEESAFNTSHDATFVWYYVFCWQASFMCMLHICITCKRGCMCIVVRFCVHFQCILVYIAVSFLFSYAHWFYVQNERWVSLWSVSISCTTTSLLLVLLYYLMNKGSVCKVWYICHLPLHQLTLTHYLVKQLRINKVKTILFLFCSFRGGEVVVCLVCVCVYCFSLCVCMVCLFCNTASQLLYHSSSKLQVLFYILFMSGV